ncbi:hypothetical protein [Schleiferia thermophila]
MLNGIVVGIAVVRHSFRLENRIVNNAYEIGFVNIFKGIVVFVMML